MARITLDWEEIQAVSLGETRIIALTDVGALIFMACSPLYRNRFAWKYGQEDITDSQWDEIEKAIGQAEYEIMSNLVGMIFPHAMADISGLNMLDCDGSIYNRVDYPLLYEKIDPALRIDADTFSVPDLREKFPLGESIDYDFNSSGGEIEHTLTGLEMPEHTHDNAPHAHTEITAVSSLGAAITGVPVPSAIPSIGTTGFESISINPAGESQPHNNMPPYLVIRFAIVAG